MLLEFGGFSHTWLIQASSNTGKFFSLFNTKAQNRIIMIIRDVNDKARLA